jgi:hypothetical protein
MSRIRKPKASPPKTREAIMLQVRSLLAEHFDVGIAVVSWEDGGETYYMDFKYGNDYAARALCREADEILWPYETEDDEEDDE